MRYGVLHPSPNTSFHYWSAMVRDWLYSTPPCGAAQVVAAVSGALDKQDRPFEILAAPFATYCVLLRCMQLPAWKQVHELALSSYPMEWFATIYPPSLTHAFASGCFALHMAEHKDDYPDHEQWIVRFTLEVLRIVCPDGTWRDVALREGNTALLDLDGATGAR